VFREQPISRAISEIGTPSDLRSRRISAQSSTISTCFLPGSTPARVTGKLINFQLPHRDQYSVAADISTMITVDVQPDDRRRGDADVPEHAMVQPPMCRNDYKLMRNASTRRRSAF
jgi:hypothetical protein